MIYLRRVPAPLLMLSHTPLQAHSPCPRKWAPLGAWKSPLTHGWLPPSSLQTQPEGQPRCHLTFSKHSGVLYLRSRCTVACDVLYHLACLASASAASSPLSLDSAHQLPVSPRIRQSGVPGSPLGSSNHAVCMQLNIDSS